MQNETDHSRAKLSEFICFGFGSLSYAIESNVIATYIMLFCTDVLVIKVGIIGVMITLIKVLDAISDIVVMSIADKHVTRFGKYRPWILLGLADAVAFCLFFANPSFLQSETAKTVWVCVMYVLLVPVIETGIVCPIFALNSTMSEHADDRTYFSLSRSLGESAATLIMSGLMMRLILWFGESYRDITGWRWMSIIFAVIIVIGTLVGFLGTKERVITSNERDDGQQMTLGDKLSLFKGNKPVWKLVGIIVCYFFHYYFSQTVFSYFCIYVLGHEEWIAPLSSLGFAVWTVMNVLLFFLTKYFEKRSLLIFACISILAANVCLVFADGYTLAVAYQVLLGAGCGIINCIAFALIPDLSEYTEWRTGKQIPGMLSAFNTFAFKLGVAVSILASSQLLNLAHYDGAKAVQSFETVQFIRFSLPVVSSVFIAAALILTLMLHELNSDKLKLYREEINNRALTSK